MSVAAAILALLGFLVAWFYVSNKQVKIEQGKKNYFDRVFYGFIGASVGMLLGTGIYLVLLLGNFPPHRDFY